MGNQHIYVLRKGLWTRVKMSLQRDIDCRSWKTLQVRKTPRDVLFISQPEKAMYGHFKIRSTGAEMSATRCQSAGPLMNRPSSSVDPRRSDQALIYSDLERTSMERQRPRTAIDVTEQRRLQRQQQQQQQRQRYSYVSSLSLSALGSAVRVNELYTGRMFRKEKTTTTKGEKDIMLGIFKNRTKSSSAPRLEYLIERNYILNHKDAWRVKDAWKVRDEAGEESSEAVKRKNRRFGEIKHFDENDKNGGCADFRVNGKTRIVSDKKECQSGALTGRSLPLPRTPRSNQGEGQRRSISAVSMATKTSEGTSHVCRECQFRMRMTNSTGSGDSAEPVAPPCSPEPEINQNKAEIDPDEESRETFAANGRRMVLQDGRYLEWSPPARKGRSKIFLTVHIPTTELNTR